MNKQLIWIFGILGGMMLATNSSKSPLKSKKSNPTAEPIAANRNEFDEIRAWLWKEARKKHIKKLVRDDWGSCVVGQGVELLTKFGIERKSRARRLISNIALSVREQPDALNALMKLAKKKFPKFKNSFSYNCGRID